MSSINATKKYRIVLFQDGLQDKTGFDQTRRLMKETNSAFLNYSPRIDMSDYNPDDGCFYGNINEEYAKSEQAENAFKASIAKLVQCAKEHPNVTILVGTTLNHGFKSSYYLDSIKNQRIKLIRIIDEIKQYPEIELDLVGHSQGGLVNLETAIEKNKSIAKVISISTPYAPVYLGERLIFLDFFCSLGGKSAYEIFCGDRAECDAYRSCVEILCSSSYYNDLKNKWNNLIVKPKLTVITGTSGHLYKRVPGVSVGGSYVPDTITKEPFDGLVKFAEQSNIENANFIHLVNKKIQCYEDKTYAQNVCFYQSGIFLSCKRICALDSISLSSTLFDALVSLIDNAINGHDIEKLVNYDVAKAIFAGIRREPGNMPAGYESYYNIYADDYSHNYIRYNSETIGYLMSLLVKN